MPSHCTAYHPILTTCPERRVIDIDVKFGETTLHIYSTDFCTMKWGIETVFQAANHFCKERAFPLISEYTTLRSYIDKEHLRMMKIESTLLGICEQSLKGFLFNYESAIFQFTHASKREGMYCFHFEQINIEPNTNKINQ